MHFNHIEVKHILTFFSYVKIMFLGKTFYLKVSLFFEMFQCNVCDLKCIKKSIFFRHVVNVHRGLEGLVPAKMLLDKKRSDQKGEVFKCYACEHVSSRFVCESMICTFHKSQLKIQTVELSKLSSHNLFLLLILN
jgi:hypothetical protein